MKRRYIPVFIFAIALMWAAGAAAQIPSLVPSTPPTSNVVPAGTTVTRGSDDQPLPVFRSRSDEVNVIFTVTDKHNKFVKDLKQTSFTILDNNLPPRQITNF